MPTLGGIVRTDFGHTPKGADRSWIPDPRYPLGTRAIRSGAYKGCRMVATPYQHGGNIDLVGEIVGSVGRENGRIFAPYTLVSLAHAADEIKTSHEDRLALTERQLQLLMQAQEQLLNWRANPISEEIISLQLGLVGERLLRAVTQKRLVAAERIDQSREFRDSLGRPNPLIARQNFRLAASELVEQLRSDLEIGEAVTRRIEMAASLWEEVMVELPRVWQLTESDLDAEAESELLRVLEGLQIKPFSHFVGFVLHTLRDRQLVQPMHLQIRDGLSNEIRLVHVDLVLSQIKRDPSSLERVDLSGFLDATSPEPLDIAYKVLWDHILLAWKQMNQHYHNKELDEVQKRAENAKRSLRYRGGVLLKNVWHQPPIVDGVALPEHPYDKASERRSSRTPQTSRQKRSQ